MDLVQGRDTSGFFLFVIVWFKRTTSSLARRDVLTHSRAGGEQEGNRICGGDKDLLEAQYRHGSDYLDSGAWQ